MKLEDQVVSLEIAKRLKELGFKQDSLFYHCINAKTFGPEQIAPHLIGMAKHGEEYYSAFTVAELGEILPPDFLFKGVECGLFIHKESYNAWTVKYCMVYIDFYKYSENKQSEAMGKMLICLIENGHIKPGDIIESNN